MNDEFAWTRTYVFRVAAADGDFNNNLVGTGFGDVRVDDLDCGAGADNCFLHGGVTGIDLR